MSRNIWRWHCKDCDCEVPFGRSRCGECLLKSMRSEVGKRKCSRTISEDELNKIKDHLAEGENKFNENLES